MKGLLLSFGRPAKSIQTTDEEDSHPEDGDEDQELTDAAEALLQGIKDNDVDAVKAALRLVMASG